MPLIHLPMSLMCSQSMFKYFILGTTQTFCLPNFNLNRPRFESTEVPKESRRKYFTKLYF